MSTESSKVVWITVAVAAFVLVIAIAGVFLFYPRNEAPAAPATVGNTAAPKPLDPQDYLNAPAAAPTETKRNGDVIVIYGDNPQNVPALDSGSGTAGAYPDATGTSPAAGTGGSGPTTTTTTTTTTTLPAPAVSGATPSPAPTTVQPKSVAKPSAATPTASAPTATGAKKPVAAKPAASSQYWIQAASFTERAKADSLRESLGAKGLAALIAVKDINGKSWYRVRIGPYSSSKEATGWLGKVKLVKGCEEAFVSTEALKP